MVLDLSEQVADDPDFLLEPEHLDAWETVQGPIPDGAWLILRTGWGTRAADPVAFANADAHGPHTPGPSAAAAQWLAESPITGFGVETVGIDAGQAGGFDPAFPAHYYLLGADKYGLTHVAERRGAAADRRGPDGRAVADRRRDRQPGAGVRVRRAAS